GTAPYMSPEQVQFVRSDPRSDLFALGVTLYHLATGARAFGNPSNVAGLRRRLYRDPVPPRALRPDCPPWLQEIILRCLDAEPNRRHQSAAQLAFDLQNPDQVVLTDRAERRSRHGALRTLRRWFAALGAQPRERWTPSQLAARSPIVLAAADVAAAIIEFARKNQVDHIVIGARSSSMLRRYLGSVSTQVVAESGCNVTVVRATE